MQLEVGQIVNGKVVKITKFGAFVKIAPNLTGLVHISEISKNFVSNISNFLAIGDEIKVKIIKIEAGKLNLSIKQAQDLKPKLSSENNNSNTTKPKKDYNANPATFKKSIDNHINLSFEEMLTKFKKSSEENLANVKRNFDNKRSSYSKRH